MPAPIVCGLIILAAGTVAHAESRGLGLGSRRRMVERLYDAKEIRSRLGIVPTQFPEMFHFSGRQLKRTPNRGEKHVSLRYRASMSRLLDLDPNRTVLSQDTWNKLKTEHQTFGSYQIRNPSERLEFMLRDPARKLADTRLLEERVRGSLARKLASELKGKKPSPRTLHQVAGKLAAKHPFLADPFKLELLIADTRELVPALARWDFRPDAPKQGPGQQLPGSLRKAVDDIGFRVFSHANVLFTSHMYKDGVLLLDAMRAAGLRSKNTRFVATPYPFDAGVRKEIESRGVRTAHTPYDKARTRESVTKALSYLLRRSEVNHAPILVFDDGGVASSVIAEKFANQMHRFRVVEITKAGERIAKQVLPPKLNVDVNAFRVLPKNERSEMRERYLKATSFDGTSRAAAEKKWGQIESYLRTPNLGYRDNAGQNILDGRVFGFAHYTYSDSSYKREVMTPRYTEQVNKSTFEALTHGRRRLKNKRVTIIGGGAMGLNAGLELKGKKFDVTFVEPDPVRASALALKGFSVQKLDDALGGRGMVMDLSGMRNLITTNHLFKMDNGTVVVQGSSKDNPFDMSRIRSIASRRFEWRDSPTGQRSASYVFQAAGLKKLLHFPGDGYAINHAGKSQSVPLEKFMPEAATLLRLGAHALTDRPATHFPFFGTPEGIASGSRNGP